MAHNWKQTQKNKINLTLHNIPLAYIIDDVIDIELINTRYKWIQLPKAFFFYLWFDINFIARVLFLWLGILICLQRILVQEGICEVILYPFNGCLSATNV